MKNRIVIFGNSGSGKSTLAKALSSSRHLTHLDLDTLAWREDEPTKRREVGESQLAMQAFFVKNSAWVIEGCYADILTFTLAEADLYLFLNPGVDTCVEHCRQRPWEPHKYASKEAQDANLSMLVDWVRQYESRQDEFSLQAHQRLFDQFSGEKVAFHQPVDVSSVP